jgi:hypothetical protein
MTIISFRHRFIFLANMKCGSTTLHKLLTPFADLIADSSIFQKPIGKHDNARQVKSYIESQGYKWEDFYVFTTIRNPLPRIVSCYNFEIQCGYLDSTVQLDSYIRLGRYYEHFQDIDFFIKPSANQIIKMEEFQLEIPKLWLKLGLGEFNGQIPITNTTKSKGVDQFFTDNQKKNLVQLLKKRHPKDYQYYS